MKKIKNFDDFLKESFFDSSGISKLGYILSKGSSSLGSKLQSYSSPSSGSSPSVIPVSPEIKSADKYKEYGTDPVEIAKDFEPIATGPYKWVSGSSGMPTDIYFKSDDPLFKKPSDSSTYCTGFTFAVGFITCLNRGLLNDFTDSNIKKMQEIWNVGDPKSYPKLCVDAIANPISTNLKSLGEEVTAEEAKEGDFCQIWRSTGSGHSVIVLEMVKKDGKTVGIKYYSSNSKINSKTKRSGPGENTEYFSDSGGNVLRKNTYFARINP